MDRRIYNDNVHILLASSVRDANRFSVFVWTGESDLNTLRRKKSPFSKTSGYVRTGPKFTAQRDTKIRFFETLKKPALFATSGLCGL